MNTKDECPKCGAKLTATSTCEFEPSVADTATRVPPRRDCERCLGSGVIVFTEPRCCERPRKSGECCGDPEPEYVEYPCSCTEGPSDADPAADLARDAKTRQCREEIFKSNPGGFIIAPYVNAEFIEEIYCQGWDAAIQYERKKWNEAMSQSLNEGDGSYKP